MLVLGLRLGAELEEPRDLLKPLLLSAGSVDLRHPLVALVFEAPLGELVLEVAVGQRVEHFLSWLVLGVVLYNLVV